MGVRCLQIHTISETEPEQVWMKVLEEGALDPGSQGPRVGECTQAQLTVTEPRNNRWANSLWSVRRGARELWSPVARDHLKIWTPWEKIQAF